jgi:hypothetical protein
MDSGGPAEWDSKIALGPFCRGRNENPRAELELGELVPLIEHSEILRGILVPQFSITEANRKSYEDPAILRIAEVQQRQFFIIDLNRGSQF